jgi:hypothetical protein
MRFVRILPDCNYISESDGHRVAHSRGEVIYIHDAHDSRLLEAPHSDLAGDRFVRLVDLCGWRVLDVAFDKLPPAMRQ